MRRAATARTRSGIALLLVLIFLVLLSALIIGFFISVQSEVQSSKHFESGVAVKQLVTSATNLVAAQLVDGTRSTKTRRPPGAVGPIAPGERLAWASQPGMIRTWSESGAGWKIFKLYSSGEMVVDLEKSGPYSAATRRPVEVPDRWPALPALYTDLNEPELRDDPAGKIVRDSRPLSASYPIVDPLALTLDNVEGFTITTPPGYGGKFASGAPSVDAATDPTRFVGDGLTANPAPMPVAWIYVLEDGTLTVPNATTDSGRTAVWKKMAAGLTPSRDNPIVGRIAFWTDDETCKLNINTASEPTPWDTPRALTHRDLAYGKFQPAQREYQRFPGHPFMTALSPVLFPGRVLTPAQKEEIYKIIPRVGGGGTVGGTLSLGSAPNPIQLDQDRLFANADELLFEPKPDPVHPTRRLAISDNQTDLPELRAILEPERLRRSRFFLTAHSRAPEVTLFGTPRVSLWPVNVDQFRRTPYDRLAAFCSTVAVGSGSPFYFQRRDATSPRIDYTSIARNRELYSYLQNLTRLNFPGFGGNFLTKWGRDRDQVLTEIFDYIRCTNLLDPQPGATPFAANGQVAPIALASTTNPTKGFGRFHTISQFGIHFICSQDGAAGLSTLSPLLQPPLRNGERAIEAAFVFEPFSPSVGWPPLVENLYFDVTFGPGFKVDNKPLGFVSSGKALLNGIGRGFYNEGRNLGGAGGLRGAIAGLGGSGYPWLSPPRPLDPRVIVGAPTAAGSAAPTTMDFEGGDVTVKIYSGNTPNAARLVQTITARFPDGTFPIPDLVTAPTTPARHPAGTTPATPIALWWTFVSRYVDLKSTPFLPSRAEYSSPLRAWPAADGAGFSPGFKLGGMYRREDVVRSVVPRHGDLRLIAAQSIVDQSEWVMADADNGRQWDNGANHFAHLFVEPAGTQFSYGFLNEPGGSPGPGLPGSAAGDQLTPANYHYSRLPEIRPGAGAQFNRWNDFDNGVAQTIDGAYIGKPDEGSVTGPAGIPYWSSTPSSSATAAYFSPNRLVPSAGMLGSLPTGVTRTAKTATPHAWETLLFHPDPQHPGAASPADHLLMDLFWMPVIEPYAISEPFSTAGKVNLNYEIAPFSYLRRATALHGVLKSEEPLAIPTASLPGSPDGAAKIYKLWDSEVADQGWLPDAHGQDAQVTRDWDAAFRGHPPFDRLRKPIDPEKTLAQCEQRFAAGRIFKSATEICELHLVRKGTVEDGVTEETLAQYLPGGSFWRDHAVTGDNTRERPYANLYARLTTRSNSFTVHVRAQVLRQTGGAWSTWREDRDQRLAEHRGSTLLERYIDPGDRTLTDFAQQPNAVVDNAYRLRVISTKKFAP